MANIIDQNQLWYCDICNKTVKIKNAKVSLMTYQILKLTIKIYSNLSNINILYYLKHQIPMGQRLFFKIIAQNPEYIKNYCTDMENPFHLACRKWYFYNNPLFCEGCYQKDCNVRFCNLI